MIQRQNTHDSSSIAVAHVQAPLTPLELPNTGATGPAYVTEA